MEAAGASVRAVRRRARPRRRRRRADRVVVPRLRRVEPHPAQPDVRPAVLPVRGRARRAAPRRHPPVLRRRRRRAAPGPTTTARRCAGGRCSPSRRDAPVAARERLRRAMRDCARFIPGITRCAVGTNTAGGPIELVWETTYESVGAYRSTYMTHPYHAALLDRFLLPDCPERITTHNTFGAGSSGTRSTASGRSVRWRCGASSCSSSTTMHSARRAAAAVERGRRRVERFDPGREHHVHTVVRWRDGPRRHPRVDPCLGPVLRLTGAA